MSIFDTQTYREIPEVDKEDLRQQVTMAQVVSFLGMEWDRTRRMVKCPRHAGGNEKTPSAQVNAQTLYCHACHHTWDVYGLIQDKMGMSFADAKEWLSVNLAALPAAQPIQAQRESNYHGPAPIEMVRYWHSCLRPDHREWLHQARLLTDGTIDRAGIGWRPEQKAYCIPFWRGQPWYSEVDIVQHRASPERLEENPDSRRWWGYEGHNRPSWINGHRVGIGYVVLLFGTLDALLADQDGLAAISINGATAFMRDRVNIERLKAALAGAATVYVVPDKTPSEFKAAYALAQHLGAEVRHFPFDAPGKDYTEYRQAGKSVYDFMEEVLMLPSPWPKENGDRPLATEILRHVAAGDPEKALAQLLELQEKGYLPAIVSKELQFLACFDPFAGLTGAQWESLRNELEFAGTWEKVAGLLKKWAGIAYGSRGTF